MFDRYNLENLKRVLENPRNLFLECVLLNGWFYRRVAPEERMDVLDREWDNLLILDACRYDMFEELSNLPGELERGYSKGTESWSFLQENFAGKQLHDTIYVTANPHAFKLPEETFYKQVNLLEDEWDEELRTVRPELLVESAIKMHKDYPNKRLIVHFMQPHYPFIGSDQDMSVYGGIEYHLPEEMQTEYPSPWTMHLGPFSKGTKEFVQAYRENYEPALEYAGELIEALDGRSVVTSDHGNLVGEWTFPIPVRGYGHPEGVHHPKLLEVPWLVVDGDRRKVNCDPPQGNSDLDEGIINNRLKSLGYKS